MMGMKLQIIREGACKYQNVQKVSEMLNHILKPERRQRCMQKMIFSSQGSVEFRTLR